MTSGASDEPPIPQSTTWSSPCSAAGARAARRSRRPAVARTGQRGPGQPDGRLGLGLGTPQGGVLGEQPAGEPVGDQGRHVLRDRVGRRTCGDDAEGDVRHLPLLESVVGRGLGRALLDVGQQLAPGLLELVDALALEDVRRRRRSDAEALAASRARPGRRRSGRCTWSPWMSPWSATASRVLAGMVLTVFGGDQVIDVHRVAVGGVLDAGGRPQRALLVRTLGREHCQRGVEKTSS